MDETGDEKAVLVVVYVVEDFVVVVVDVAAMAVLTEAEDVGADAVGIGGAQELVEEEVEGNQ